MNKYYKTRRDFIKQFGIAALGTTLPTSIMQLKAIKSAFLRNSAAVDGYKALVCFFQSGGNDSFNMLIPRGAAEYAEYAETRSNLAIPQSDILPINPITSDGKQYGLHPSFSGIQNLFDDGKLSFVSNIGSLIVPTTKSDFQNDAVPLPLGLFSHSDQQQQWQTASSHVRTPYGWGGELASLMQSQNDNDNISMNISTAGTNVFQYGQDVVEFSIRSGGRIEGLLGYDKEAQAGFNYHRTQAIDAMLDKSYANIYDDTYAKILRNARDGSLEFRDALEQVGNLNTTFSDNGISESFEVIAQTIAARDILGFKRQIFYVEYGGWDHHDRLITSQEYKLGIVNDAMVEFAAALEEIGMFDQVTTFSISEFGRTLTSNGNGSDHAWGGNVMSMGGAVNGKDIFGTYPSLEINNPQDIYNGVLIPTLANDLYFAELALWFGVAPSELNNLFPNIGNFYDTSSGIPPIGLINY